MAFPPPTLPTNRANATPQTDTHPNDHNAVNAAVNDIVAKINADAGKRYARGAAFSVNTTATGTFTIAGVNPEGRTITGVLVQLDQNIVTFLATRSPPVLPVIAVTISPNHLQIEGVAYQVNFSNPPTYVRMGAATLTGFYVCTYT